jgi:predicted small secreted protein
VVSAFHLKKLKNIFLKFMELNGAYLIAEKEKKEREEERITTTGCCLLSRDFQEVIFSQFI